jgi:hypothetical protein
MDTETLEIDLTLRERNQLIRVGIAFVRQLRGAFGNTYLTYALLERFFIGYTTDRKRLLNLGCNLVLLQKLEDNDK